MISNLLLLDELKSICQEFKKHHIETVVLKGGNLAENIYEDIACRPMGDLDILIRSEDRIRSYKILHEMDYFKLEKGIQDKMLHQEFRKDLKYIHVNLEIHHRLAKQLYMTNFDLDLIFSNNKMSLEYQLVYQSWHMIQHGIFRFIWLCDFAETVKRYSNQIEWNTTEEMKHSFYVSKQFTVSKKLVGNLLMPHFIPLEAEDVRCQELNLTDRMVIDIQKRIKDKREVKVLRKILSIHLMDKKNIYKFIPRYIWHKCIIHTSNKLEKSYRHTY